MTPRLVPFYRNWPEELRSDAHREFVDLGDRSRWFDTLVTTDIAAGSTDGPRVYADESKAETWYYITRGKADVVLPDGKVERIEPFDAVFFAPGTGAELRATADSPLTWLTLSSGGGSETPFSEKGRRGASTATKLTHALSPEIFRRKRTAPRQWPANKLGASAKPWWFYTVEDRSRWFHSGCISCIAPGGASTFHSHMERFEGPYETWYIVLQGTAFVRNEYEDFLFEGGPSGVFVPADASHQIINNGDDLLWYLTISSRGGEPLRVDVYNMPSGVERPGYLEEYNRIIGVRTANGLPVP